MAGQFMMLVLYGPTVTGKTDFAIKLAKKYNGELISADSRQVYKSLDIGTGKVSPNARVEKHKGYWIVDDIRINGFDLQIPGRRFTVVDFIDFAEKSITEIHSKNKIPIVVGGTGFYIKGLIDGIVTQGVPINKKLRRKLEKFSKQELYKELLRANPVKAQSLNDSDKQNPRRLIRALEISLSDEKHYKNENKPIKKFKIIGLTAPNDYLFNKADSWLDNRLELGLKNEIDSLIKRGISKKWLVSLGLEYRWLTLLSLHEISHNEAIVKLKRDIHNLIRRQKTYFKQFPNIRIFSIDEKNWQNEAEKYILN